MELQFAADRSALPGSAVPGGLPVAGSADQTPLAPTALQEQLGVKLDARRGMAEILVVDRVSEPSED